MTKLKHEYYFVKGHLGEDYFVIVDPQDPVTQAELIEETCDQCGDNDIIIGAFNTIDDGESLINDYVKSSNIVSEYKQTLIKKLKSLE